jgi:rod shape-determining protein MreC
LHFFGFTEPIEKILIQYSVVPVQKTTSIVQAIREQLFVAKNSDPVSMEQKLTALETEVAWCRMTYDENAALRNLLAFSKQEKRKMVTADVVSLREDRQANTLIINRGSDDGIVPDRAVIAENGILIGKTLVVNTKTTHVLLLNDNESRVIASIAGKEKATGSIKGEFQLGLTMELIPIAESIQEGDRVITAGIEEHIPKGLLIGSLADIKTKPTDFFHVATVQPALSYSTLRIVSVVLPE